MEAIKPTKLAFKKMESEWYNYYHTLHEITRLREIIANPFKEDPDENIGAGSNSVRTPGDPTGKLATRLTTNKQLDYLNSVVVAVKEVYDALPSRNKEVAWLRYWSRERMKWEGVALEVGVSERQARRWRDEWVIASIELIGWR